MKPFFYKMNKTVILLLTLPIFFIACKKKQTSYDENKVIAEVGSFKLRAVDIQGLVEPGTKAPDSIMVISGYIEQWARSKAWMVYSEKKIATDQRVEDLVSEYRASLLTQLYEQKLFSELLDTIVTSDQISTFAKENKDEFTLSQDYAKCLVAKISKDAPDIKKMEKLWKSSKTADQQEVLNWVKKYNTNASLDENSWMSFSEIKIFYPTLSSISSNKTIFEKEGNYYYLLKTKSHINSGEDAPLEMVKPQIAKMIIHERKLKLVEDEINKTYDKAVSNNQIKIYHQ
jgi:hypothetical protein